MVKQNDSGSAEQKNQKDFITTILFGWSGIPRIMRDKKTGFLFLASIILAGCGFPFLLIITIPWWILDVMTMYFFTTDKFYSVKSDISKNTQDCNELNRHIEELKSAYSDVKKIDYGNANYKDNSVWNYTRKQLKTQDNSQNVYQCSLSVCRNASRQPFKYLCKYFNIKPDEATLEKFESTLNDFSAAEQGKISLEKERNEILDGIKGKVPSYVYSQKDLLFEKLGFDKVDFSQMYFPHYTFQYISGGGNSSMRCDVILDVDNLDKFVNYLGEIVKFRKSAAGQRALMTSSLREKIKERDHYTCRKCKNSTKKEPNLLLEIDHKIPIAKGGMTTESNLQTLCWRCNRTKGAKIEA